MSQKGFQIIVRSQIDPTKNVDCVFRSCVFRSNYVHEVIEALTGKIEPKLFCCAQHDALLTANHIRTNALVLDMQGV